jgi:hypothetical protein
VKRFPKPEMKRKLENMSRIYGSIFAALLSACAALAQPFTVSTYAGAPLGSGKLPAAKAILEESQGLAIDAAGNLYFNSLNSIFQVNAAGILVRVAGNLHAGYSGDSGTAPQMTLSTDPARPSSPIGIADRSYGQCIRCRSGKPANSRDLGGRDLHGSPGGFHSGIGRGWRGRHLPHGRLQPAHVGAGLEQSRCWRAMDTAPTRRMAFQKPRRRSTELPA